MKIHRATVTEANINYRGSVTIDKKIVQAAGLLPGQLVRINNYRTADTWETYVVEGEAGSGVICLNGPPALRFQAGDKVVIRGDGFFTDYREARDHKVRVVYVDDKNNVTEVATH